MTLSKLLEESSKKYPNRTALISGETRLSYQALYLNTVKVAQGLSESGIQEGQKVVLFLKNSSEFITAAFALSHIGAIVVPANFMINSEELQFICGNVGASAVITQSSFLNTVQSVQSRCPGLKTIWVTDFTSHASAKPFAALLDKEPRTMEFKCEDQGIIFILYTSGTTGTPKGTMLSHNNLTSNVDACIEALSITPNDRFMCLLPMFHVFAWTTNVLIPLRIGCPIVIVESIRPPKPWLKLMWKHKITLFAAVPQIYSLLAEQAKGFKKWVLRYIFFGRVKICISGAAPLMTETLQRFEANLQKPLLEGYGLSETAPVITVNTLQARKPGSVGKCIPKVKVKIIHEDGTEAPMGTEGEICVLGPNVMQGYYQLPEATREIFTHDGWLRTGDIGKLDSDGFLYIHDRIKDMIIVKGLKVFSAQVEEVLLNHPAVMEAAVVGIPNPSGDETVKGFVVLKPGAQAGKSELLEHCKEKLPGYKRPRTIEIIAALPKNALHKVLKRELRAQNL